MKRHLIPFAFVALAFAISSTARAQQAITPDQLVGVWKLQSIVNHDASTGGKKSQDLGQFLRARPETSRGGCY